MKNLLIAIVCAVMWASSAQAQGFPSRPITMIVPLPAGSAFDVTARVLAERMQVSLGQPVLVKNVLGAAGSIGIGRFARRTGRRLHHRDGELHGRRLQHQSPDEAS